LIERMMAWYAEPCTARDVSDDGVSTIHAINQGIHGLYARDWGSHEDVEIPERRVVDGCMQRGVEMGMGG
jgi:hypothetical protein